MDSIKIQDNNRKTQIYLIPGQSADYRLFSNLSIDKSFEIKNIIYHTPDKNVTLPNYARQLANQIDTTIPYIIIGVSLTLILMVGFFMMLNFQRQNLTKLNNLGH